MIELKEVTKEYSKGITALNGINLRIEQGEFVFVVGDSGSGKSTLIRLLMKEIEPTSGTIIVNGQNLNRMKHRQIPQYRRGIGVVFQDFRLIETMTVYENVAFAMRVIGCSNKTIRRRVPYVLGIVGLGHKSKNYPKELSGGEQQRVALARALVNNPKTIIADEPTGNVDPALAREIMELLIEINKMGTTVIVITHDQKLVDEFNKRVIALRGGQIISDTTGGYEYNERG